MPVESWDDDADFTGDLYAPSLANTNVSSKLSTRSESNFGEEDWSVSIAPNDAKSTFTAITSANQVGIPIPQNVPSSALLGGTIKRLGKTKSRPNVADDWGEDFDIPIVGGGPLKLRNNASIGSTAPATPATDQEEFDSEWAEGSLGTRFAGTRRDTRGRSSSVSAMSPSMGSCMTIESEDDDLGGLDLPNEPIDFNSRLKKRQISEYDGSEHHAPPTSLPAESHSQAVVQPQQRATPVDEDDMMAGLDFDGGDLVDSKRRKINRNVRIAQPKASTPAARTGTSLTFTDKSSRIPRPSSSAKTQNLDTVPEAVNASPVQRQPSRASRQPPTTTSAQLLRSKRSAPLLGSRHALSGSRPPVPFLPAGVATAQSQHVTAKSGSFHYRQVSDSHVRPSSPTHRSQSRLSTAQNPSESTPSRTGFRKDGAAASLLRQAANQRTLQVTKRRQFGDGSELDRFDDLPTSATKESKFTKQPSQRTQPKSLRSTASRRNLISHDNSQTPIPSNASTTSTVPTTPLAPPTPRAYFPQDATPRFARDTAASRNAREQRLGNPRPRGSGPIEAVAINWKAQIAARSPQTSPSSHRHKNRGEIRKPVLIKHMGPTSTKSESSCERVHLNTTNIEPDEKGMVYNPTLQRWEGNEHALTKFENPSTSTLPHYPTHKDNHSHHHHTNSIPSGIALAPRDHNAGARNGSPPRPALISQISTTRGVVVERGMVFDPQRMTWLKIDSRTLVSDPMLQDAGFGPPSISVEEEEDPFAAIEDLVDERTAKIAPGAGGIRASLGKENEDWVVGEEFDLGPAFVRRQRNEEADWRRKVEKWMGNGESMGDSWRWEIRRVAERYEGLR
jgi:hypothetical protein